MIPYELIALVGVCFAGLRAWQAIELKKTEIQKQIAQAEAETAITKSRIWSQSQERQTQIASIADSQGFASTDGGFSIENIMQYIATPQGQQLLEGLLKKKEN